jgi:hypothetical protein
MRTDRYQETVAQYSERAKCVLNIVGDQLNHETYIFGKAQITMRIDRETAGYKIPYIGVFKSANIGFKVGELHALMLSMRTFKKA